MLYIHAVCVQGGREYGYFCSGTLIAPSWVLTAWHCLDDLNGALVVATVGRPDMYVHIPLKVAPLNSWFACKEPFVFRPF